MRETGLIECVVNISEGTDPDRVDLIARAAASDLLDVHRDADHNRSVLTVLGEGPARAIAAATVLSLDLRGHHGAHPRIGVLDVVPFVPLGETTMADAVAARDEFARWVADDLGVPCFLYGPDAAGRGRSRTLPEIRRHAFVDLTPDVGPAAPHPSAGAVAVGARPVLVAYNLWLATPDLVLARTIAAGLRGEAVRALALQVGDRVQVSMNLIDPARVGPAEVYDAVAAQASIDRAELVGLAPRLVLDRIDEARWDELDLHPDATIEARLAARGIVDASWRALP